MGRSGGSSVASRRAGRGRASEGGRRGTSPGSSAEAPSATASTTRAPSGSARAAAAAASPARASPATRPKCSAAPVAILDAPVPCRAVRSSFISAPVSIVTGQAAWHIESPAQVVDALVGEVLAQRLGPLAVAPAAPLASSRAISRVTTIRWRGVSVRSREGQRGSQ